MVSGLHETQVLDISFQKEFSERQSIGEEVDLFRGTQSTNRVWATSAGESGTRVQGRQFL